jgi:hypothetical protein
VKQFRQDYCNVKAAYNAPRDDLVHYAWSTSTGLLFNSMICSLFEVIDHRFDPLVARHKDTHHVTVGP